MTDPLAADVAIQNLPGQVGKALRNAKQYHRNPTSLDVGTGVVGSTTVTTDIETSGWICRENPNESQTWQRDVTPYVNGVAGATTTIDSGINCSEPQPPAEFEYQSVELCVSGQVQVQMLQSVNGGAFQNFGAPIPTGKLCGQGEYVGQICYEEIPGYVTTVATTGFVANGDEQGTSSSWTITYNGSGLDLNVGRIAANIRAIFGQASNYVARITNNVGEVFDSAPVGGITGIFQPIEFVWSNPPVYGPGETLNLTFVGTGSVRIQTQSLPGTIQSVTVPIRRPLIRLDTLLPAPPKRTAYGLRNGTTTTYYDSETSQILVAGTYAVCPPVQESIENQGNGPILTTPQAITILEGDVDAQNNWTFADLPGGPISRVRSFTVLNTSQADMTVTTEKGTTTLIPGGIRTWGEAQGLLDVSQVVINVPDEPVNLIWEE